MVDESAQDLGGVVSDVTTLEWVWMRIAHTVDSANAGLVVAQLDALRAAADAEDMAAASAAAGQLRDLLASLN